MGQIDGSDVGTSKVSRVKLVEFITIPSQKDQIVNAKVAHPVGSKEKLLFEANHKVLKSFGSSTI